MIPFSKQDNLLLRPLQADLKGASLSSNVPRPAHAGHIQHGKPETGMIVSSSNPTVSKNLRTGNIVRRSSPSEE